MMTLQQGTDKTVETIKTLIADNNTWFREYIKSMLTPVAGIEVIAEATSGQEALDKAGALRPDLVLAALKMPGLNGLQVSHRLKQEMPEVKIIILVVFDDEMYRDVVTPSGADEYVTKRTIIKELMPAIRRVIQNP